MDVPSVGDDDAPPDRDRVRALYETVLARAPVAAVVLDSHLHVQFGNQAFSRIGDATPGADLEVALPALVEALRPLVAAALTDKTATDRAVVRSASMAGTAAADWEVSAFPIDDRGGAVVGVGLFLEDVTEERRTARKLRDSVAKLAVTLSAGGLATWDWDLGRGEGVWGLSAEEAVGIAPRPLDRRTETFLAAIHEDDREAHRQKLVAAARAGGDFRNEVRLAREDGETQWIEVRGRVVAGADGTSQRMVGVVIDITERRLMEAIKTELLHSEHQARLEAEVARDRLALVSEVGAALLSTLDTRKVLEALPDLLVPRICDWCTIDLFGPAGGLEEIRTVHVDPSLLPLVRESRIRRLQAGGYGLWSVRRTMATGTSELALEIEDEDLIGVATDDEHLALLRRLAPRSTITVPLVSQGEVLGGITVVATNDRRFEPDDLVLMETLAGRLAVAVENAQLFESRTQVARALQQTLLPPTLPAIPGMDLVARYRVAADGIDIGGDFYDAFEPEGGTWAIVIGDVCGKGAEAAAVTGLFRHTLRAVAMAESSPQRVLRKTNDAILGRIDDTRFCTAVYLTVRPAHAARAGEAGGAAEITLSCGGHPRPMVVRADGTVEKLEITGTLLGVLPEPVLADVEVKLGAGDSLVLYTDGVIEARSGPDWLGEAGLEQALRSAVAAGATSADGLADHLLAEVDRYQAGVSNDDIAIVVLHNR